MRTVDPAKHEAKRRHILDTAAACFARKGFDSTTVANICEAAGISSGSLFHYFPSKRAIFTAIFEQDERDIAKYVAETADSDDPWGDVLGLVDTLVEPLADPANAGLVMELVRQAGRDDEFAAMVARSDSATREGLTELLRRAAERGQIDDSLDLATAATWITALVDGLFSRASVDTEFAPLDQLPTLRLILTRSLRAEPR